jgi:hypothetical protein
MYVHAQAEVLNSCPFHEQDMSDVWQGWNYIYSILQLHSLAVEFLGSNTSDFVTLSVEMFLGSWLVCSLKMLFQYYYLWAMICTKMG